MGGIWGYFIKDQAQKQKSAVKTTALSVLDALISY